MVLRRTESVFFLLLGLPVVLLLGGCSSLQSLSILPTSGSVVLTAVGQTAQFTALGVSQTGNATPTTSNISTSVSWTSSSIGVATISASGLATAVGAGTTQITAQSNGVIATSDLTVSIAGSTTGGTTSGSGATPSISIIPSSQSVLSPGKTAQFIAVATATSGSTSNVTSQVNWSSSSPQIVTIGATTGLATAVGQGTATITALYTNSSGSIETGSATFTVTGATTEQFTAVTILPGSQALSASGQTGQFIALGTSGSTGLQQDVTASAQIKWSSSIPSIATVSASGLVTGISAGSSTITAILTNPDGSVVSATAGVAVSLASAPEPLLSLTIVPNSITVGNLQGTGQFLAIGTFSTVPYVRDLTNSPTLTWISSAPSIFPVNTNTAGSAGSSAGIVTAYGSGNAVIIAEAKSSDGTIQTATATFNCPLVPPTAGAGGSCYPGSQAPALLATLTIYNEGANTTGWLVTAPSATGTANVLHCGPGAGAGGSVCVATYPIGTVVTVTAPSEPGVSFGGWSYNCPVTSPVSAVGPNTCQVTLTTNDTVGAIFN